MQLDLPNPKVFPLHVISFIAEQNLNSCLPVIVVFCTFAQESVVIFHLLVFLAEVLKLTSFTAGERG